MKKRRLLKSIVAMVALMAMLMENTYSVMASINADNIVLADDAVISPDEAAGDVITIEEPAQDTVLSEDKGSNELVTDEAPSKEIDIKIGDTDEDALISEESSVNASDDKIEVTGRKDVTLYINTGRMRNTDSFYLDITGSSSLEYDNELAGKMKKDNGGVYYIEGLDNARFTVKATGLSEGLSAQYRTREDGNPQISLISDDEDEVAKNLRITDSGSEVKGSGYGELTLKLNGSMLPEATTYNLYIITDSDVRVDGNSVVKGEAVTFDTEARTARLSNLNNKAFTLYIEGKNSDRVFAEYTIDSKDNGVISVTLAESDSAVSIEHEEAGEKEEEEEEVRNEKRVYEYRDADVYVTATLEDPEAIPDDADFVVTKLDRTTSDYNYDAYMQALNNNADAITGEENSVISDSDVLLYDIAFYTKDENGNRIELQPEDSSVSIKIRFKKDQLKDELGAESAENVTTVHLPLADSVKEGVNTTAEATDITASDIKVEVVSDNTSIENESVGFTLNDLSVAAVLVNGTTMKPGSNETFKSMLGSAAEYGIVANTVKFTGHFESNVAVGKASGTGPMAAPKNDGGNAGKAFIGEYTGSDFLIDNNGNKSDFVIYTTDAAKKNFGQNMQQPRSGVVIDTTTYTKDQIQTMVSNMVSTVATKSAYVADNEPSYRFSAVSQKTNDKTVVDLVSKGSGAGTYFITLDAGEFAGLNKLKVILGKDQRVVFNIPDKSVSFSQYEVELAGKQYTTQGNSDEDLLSQSIIFNCPNATTAKTTGPCAGTFILPKADFTNGAVSAGWVIADKISAIGGQEWHCVYHDMPPAKGCSAILEAKKTVDWKTPAADQKFWFDLYSYDFNTKKSTLIQSVQNNGEKITFSPFFFNQEGVYAYILKEREESDAFIHDPNVYTIHYKVRLNNSLNKYEIYEKNVYVDNKLVGSNTKCSDEDSKEISFNNQTAPKVPFDFNITKLFYKNDGTNWADKKLLDYDEYFKKYGYGSDWPDNATFTFDIERFDGGTTNSGIRMDGPMPEKTTITLTKDKRSGSFGKVYFAPDTDWWNYGGWEQNNGVYTKIYMYKITERIPDDAHKVPGVFYTERPVYVKIFVNSWWDSAARCAKVEVLGRASYVNDNSIQGQGCFPISSSNLEFVNAFYSGSLKVKKNAYDIDGKTKVDNDKDFYVVVYRKAGNDRVYYGTDGKEYLYPHVEKVKGNSEITFKPIPMGYKYYVYESDEDGNQINSSQVYTVSYENLDADNSILINNLCYRDKEVTINNKRKPGNLKLIKKGENGEVLKGAEFVLYKDGKLLNNSTYTTDDNGVVTVNSLRWGTYYFVETKAPAGYVLPEKEEDRKTGSATIDASTASKTLEIVMTDEKIRGLVELYKVDDKGNALAGATFKLYKSDESKDTKVQVKTSGSAGVYKYDESGANQELATDSKGHLTVTGLPFGTYRIYEEKAPSGHNKDINPRKFTIDKNGHVEKITFINTPVKANVEFLKVDADNKPLKSVGFTLYRKTGTGKDKIDTAYSDDEGHVIFKSLGAGDYVIMEEAYEGYVDNTKAEYPFSIKESDNGKTITLPDVWKIGDLAAIVNTPETGKAQLFKYVLIGDEKKALEGAEFDLYKDGKKYNTTKLVTGADGLITVTDLPWGSYYFIETKPPVGFNPNTEKKSFAISRNKRDFTGAARLELEDTPIKGYVELLKVDEKDTEHALPGVAFGLYKGTPEKPDGKIKSYTTDENGMITAKMVGALEYGDYYFVEEKTIDGYKLTSEPVAFSISKDKETIKLTVTNPRLFGSVKLEKYDSSRNKKLNGAEFELWTTNPKNALDSFMGLFGKDYYYYDTYTTENGGVITVDNLPWGNYYFKEIKAPKGYVFDPNKQYRFTINNESLTADLTYEYGAVNEEEPGAIMLEKDDGEGNPLAGAKFELFKDGVRYPNTEKIYETGTDGIIAVDDLPWGTYYFVEVEAPEGFVTPEGEAAKTSSVTINENNTKSSVTYNTIEKSNTPIYGEFSLRKVDDNRQPLEGAQFSLVKIEDGKSVNVELDGSAGHYTFVKTKGLVSVKKILDTDGANLSVTGLPYGTYRIKEEKAPEGYKKVDNEYEFIIDSNGKKIEYDFVNPLVRANIVFLKKDDSDAPVEGAVFKLERIKADGIEDFGTMTSDKNGRVAKNDLGTGDYRITEVSAPDGYEINNGIFTFKITEKEDGQTLTLSNPNKLDGKIGVVIEPRKKGSVKLWKAIKGTNTGLKGAQFALYKKGVSTPVYTELESDQDGYVRVSELEWGTYYFKETKAPYGYILDDKTEYAFEINAKNVSAEVTVDLKGNELRVDNTPILGQAELVKKNSENEDPIEGAEFTLFTAEGVIVNGYEKMTSDKNGVIRTGKDLRAGSYYFMETKAAPGYTKTDDKYEFTITQANMDKVVKAGGDGIALNPPKLGKAELLKYTLDEDGTTKKPLSGAVFTLYRQNKWFIFNTSEKVDDYVTNAKGIIRVEDLAWGDYYFEETKAPEGYEPFKGKISFTINATQLDYTGEYKRMECENTPLKGSVKLIKKYAIDDKIQGPLEGAKFRFFRRDNGISTEIASTETDGLYTTDKNGEITITSLDWGTYYFEEIEAPEGYALPANTISRDLVIDASSVEDSIKTPLSDELVNDKIYGNVKLLKIDDSKPAKTLAGAEFALYKEDGSHVYVTGDTGLYAYSQDKTDTVITTDKDGVVRVEGLPYGKYYFQETKQPDEFVINLEHVNFEIITNQKKGDPAQIEVTCMNSTAYAGVEFIKADTTADYPLEGVVFKLYKVGAGDNGEDLFISDVTSNEDGIVSYEGLTVGDYYFTEYSVPDDAYEIITTPFYFTIKTEDNGKTVGLKDVADNTVINTPKKGSVKLTKKYSVNGYEKDVLEGAEFELYRTSVSGNSLIAKDKTNSEGIITVNDLEWGTYFFIETSAPEGYTFDPERKYEFVVNGKKVNEVQALIAGNDRLPGEVEIEKIDAKERSKTLDGVVFKLFKGEGTNDDALVATLVTENGKASYSGLEWGKYTLREYKTIDGYVLDEITSYSFVIDGSHLKKSYTGPDAIPNTPIEGTFELLKKDKVTNDPIPQVQFDLYKVTGSEKKFIGSYLTNSNGKLSDSEGNTIIGPLKYGNYELEEVIPKGYTGIECERELKFKIERNGQHISFTDKWTVYNTPDKGSVILRKVDDDNKRPLAGAKFKLYAKNPRTIGDTLATLTNNGWFPYSEEEYETDANGVLSVSGLDWNDYYFVETQAPKGYEIIEPGKHYEFTVDADNLGTIDIGTIGNKKKLGTLELKKLDSKTGDELEGAEFKLFRVSDEGDIDVTSQYKESSNGVFTTSDKGLITVTDVEWGSYYFKETKAPKDYEAITDTNQVVSDLLTIDANNIDDKTDIMQPQTTKVYNDRGYGYVSLIKKFDGEQPESLKGVKFVLVCDSDPKIPARTFETDDRGVISADVIGKLVYGDYHFEEVSVPEGISYSVSLFKPHFTISESNPLESPREFEFVNSEIRASARVIKIDPFTGEVIPGIKFGLYKAEDNSLITDIYSDSEGYVVAEHLPMGRYYFKEYADSAASKGYLATDEYFDFEITENDRVAKGEPEKFVTVYKNGTRVEAIEVPNPKLNGCISLEKLGKKLDGSTEVLNVADGEFELYKDGALFMDADATAKCVSGNSIVVSDLAWGSYYFKEIKAPDGYALPEGSAALSNTVVLDGTTVAASLTTPLVCQISDESIRTFISKKSVTGVDELAGARLELYEADASGNKIGKALLAWTSGSAPKLIEVGGEVKAGVVAGKYYLIKETKSPDNYALADDILFSVNEDGSVKTSARVTGSGNGMTVIMEDAALNISISKRELGTDKELPGATLRIMHGEDLVESWSSTGKEHVIGVPLTVGEDYVLEEVNPPKGYYTAKPITFTVNAEGGLTIKHDDSSTAEVKSKETANGTAATLVMYDRPIRVEISKKRLSGTSQDYVDGAELTLYEQQDGDEYKQIFTWISMGGKPVLVDYGLLQVGRRYKVIETKAPAGFVKAVPLTFTVMDYKDFEKEDEDGLVTQKVDVFDEAVNAVFSKKAITGDEELAGATLQVLDTEGNKIVEFVSSGKQTLVTSIDSADKLSAEEKKSFEAYDVIYGIKLETGKSYRLHEVSSPTGYAMAEDVTFKIDENGKQVPSPVVMRDKPLEIKLSKKDIGTGAYLAGAELELDNKAGEKVAGWTSSDKPVLISIRKVEAEEAAQYAEVIPVKLPAGEYTLKEVKAPEGYRVAEPVTLTITGADVKKDNGDIREETMYDYKEGSTSVVGKKAWIAPKDSEGNIAADYIYPVITIELYRDSKVKGQMDEKPYKSVTLENGATSFAFGDLEKFRTDSGQNYEYTYKVVEKMSQEGQAQYTSHELEMRKEGDENTVVFMAGFENILNQEYTDLKGIKTFKLLKDKDGKLLSNVKYDDVTIYLLRNGSRVDIDEDGKEDSVKISGGAVENGGIAEFEFKQLPRYDLTTGNAYKYTVEETGSASYEFSIIYNDDKSEVKITNVPKLTPFDIQGVKKWVDPDKAKRPDVTIQLFRDGKLYKETKLNADNTFSFKGLYEYNLGYGNDEGDTASTADGHRFLYEIREAGALGYDVKITGSGADMVINSGVASVEITNTIKQDYIELSGRKFWNDRGDSGKRPKVTVNLYASDSTGRKDEIVDTYVIPNTASKYEFGTPGRKKLPKYDKNGKVITYRIGEVELPGYVSTIKDYDITNTPSKVVISKLDATEHTELPGAVLAIIRKSDNKEVERWTSGTTPHYIEALEIGEVYILKEISAPSGYALAKDVEFQVGTNGVEQKVEMFDDPIIGSVTLTKLDASNREKLAGAEFSLYTKDGKAVAATGSTGSYTYSRSGSGSRNLVVGSNGELKVDKLPYGTYYFKETRAPKGYELKSETISFSITDHGVNVTVTCEDPRLLGAATLLKTDEDGNALSGAEFELYSKTPTTTGQAAASTVFSDAYYRYGTYTTDSSGRIRVENLPWDDYYFIETKAPEGYQTNRDVSGDPLVYTFTINADNAGSAAIDVATVTNEKIETGVLGERVPPAEKVSGVLGVRSKPKAGVLGTRVGPATGDASAIALWITLLVACIGTIVWMIASRKKKGLEN